MEQRPAPQQPALQCWRVSRSFLVVPMQSSRPYPCVAQGTWTLAAGLYDESYKMHSYMLNKGQHTLLCSGCAFPAAGSLGACPLGPGHASNVNTMGITTLTQRTHPKGKFAECMGSSLASLSPWLVECIGLGSWAMLNLGFRV